MKKLYIVPSIKTVLVSEESVICASETMSLSDKTASEAGVTSADSREDLLLGGNSLWNDEE